MGSLYSEEVWVQQSALYVIVLLNLNNLKYLHVKFIYTFFVHFKLHMCVQFPSCSVLITEHVISMAAT